MYIIYGIINISTYCDILIYKGNNNSEQSLNSWQYTDILIYYEIE